jgi:TRAP-type C4-dicarboxylate transport system substrate-binding protein
MIKSKSKSIMFKAVLVMVGLFLFSGMWSAPVEAADPIKMRFAWPLTDGHPMTASGKALIKDLEEASNGTVEIKFYGAESLGKATEYGELVQEGMADIALFTCAYNPSQYPMTRFMEMPFFSNSSKASYDVMKALLDKKLISKEFDQHKLLFPIMSPPTQLFSNKNITKTEDFKGLRLMCMGPIWNKTMGLLGAQCVTMNMQDMYIALQRGTLDAGPTGFASVMGYKWIEIVDYPIDINLMGGYPSMIIMNKKSWSKLTPEVQAAWTKVSEKHAQIWAALFDKFEEVGRSKWPAAGKEIQVFPSAEKEKLGQMLTPVYQDWIDQMEKDGKPGKAIYKTYVETMKKNGQPVAVKLPGLYE